MLAEYNNMKDAFQDLKTEIKQELSEIKDHDAEKSLLLTLSSVAFFLVRTIANCPETLVNYYLIQVDYLAIIFTQYYGHKFADQIIQNTEIALKARNSISSQDLFVNTIFITRN